MCFAFTALIQLPFLIIFWTQAGTHFWPFYLGCLSACGFVPVFNHLGKIHFARITLIFAFFCYILTASIYWQENLGIQYFMLLGVFGCPFVFNANENIKALIFMLFFSFGFLGLDAFFINLTFAYGDILLFPMWFWLFNSAVFTVSAFACSFFVQQSTKSSWRRLYSDHKSADLLLASTFPSSLIRQLKRFRKIPNQDISLVTVLFADIQGYTLLCNERPAEEVVNLLNELFSRFDLLTRQYKLEKIKTIGDEYMAVAGAPEFDHKHAVSACKCALEMQRVFSSFTTQFGLTCRLRIGLATGNVVAGVIGKDKISYDIWGQAVNLAARMQRLCKPGLIQVSQDTAQLARHVFAFTSRGEVIVKGIGKVHTYWLTGTKNSVHSQ